jgi:hypothetical protein
MTILLSPATEGLLKKQAVEQGASADDLANSILYGVLSEGITGDLSDMEAIREAIEQEKQGRYRPFSEYVAEHQAKYPRNQS